MLAAAAPLALVACGGSATATPIPPTVTPTQTATPRPTMTPAPTRMIAATPTPRAVPTVPDITGGVLPTGQALLPTAQAFLTQVAGGPATPGTPGPQSTATGVVTDVDPVALTFTLRATDGKTYVFAVSANSQVDLAALANNLFTQQQVTVIYRGAGAPYEVVGVR
jgi:hypothetical protein